MTYRASATCRSRSFCSCSPGYRSCCGSKKAWASRAPIKRRWTRSRNSSTPPNQHNEGATWLRSHPARSRSHAVPRRHPREQRRRRRDQVDSEVDRGRVAPGPRREPRQRVVSVARRRGRDAREGQRLDRQHLLGSEPRRHASSSPVRCSEGSGEQPDRGDGRGMDTEGDSCEHDRRGRCARQRACSTTPHGTVSIQKP